MLGLLSGCNAYASNSLKIINGWIPEAPPGASVMAGYMEIKNTTSQAIDIIGISSPAFKQVEMHLSKETDGFAKMLPQKKISIAAHGKRILKSGSYHLMLIKPKKWLKQGDKVTLNFLLSNKNTLTINLSIKKNNSPSMKCAAGKCGGK